MASSHRIKKPSLRTSTMLNDRAKIQAVSVSPVLRRKSNSVRKPSENHGGATVPRGYVADRDDTASAPRIKKSVTLPRKQRRSSAPSLVQQFGDALDAKHEELAEWAEASLRKTEERCNIELDEIVHYFDGQMQLMSGLEDVVDESLGDQRVGTLRDQDEKNARQGGESVLTDCIQDFRNTVIQREDTLNVLWQQWSQVHAEMICLAVEILGKHNIHLEQNSLSDAIVEGIRNAEIKNKEIESRCAEAEQSVAGLEKELNTLYEETSKTVKAQQKTWRAERKKMLDNIKKAMVEFEKYK